MLTQDRTTQTIRPQEAFGSRWWIVTGLTGLAAVAVGGFVGFVLGGSLDPTWLTETLFWVPMVAAGMITGYVGGLRGWWLLVPGAVAPLMWLGAIRAEGVLYPETTGFVYGVLIVGVTAAVTVVGIWLIRRFTG